MTEAAPVPPPGADEPAAADATDDAPPHGGVDLAGRQRLAEARGPKPIRVVSARVSIWLRLREIWRSRELFVFLVRKEIKVKYMNSFLGFLWSMLNPAFNLAVFYVLFTFFLKNGIPYFVIYLFSAILLWNLFQSGVMSGTGVMVANSGIVKKVAFPREILALASVGASVMFFVFQSVVLVIFMLVFWHRPAWGDFWLLVPALVSVVVFTTALSVFLSAVNVYLRDVQHLVEVILAAWFWAIPGIYAYGQVAPQLKHRGLLWLYFLNPLTPAVMTFQRFFYAHIKAINTTSHVPSQMLANYGAHWYLAADSAVIVVSLAMLVGALYVFGRIEGNFAEEL